MKSCATKRNHMMEKQLTTRVKRSILHRENSQLRQFSRQVGKSFIFYYHYRAVFGFLGNIVRWQSVLALQPLLYEMQRKRNYIPNRHNMAKMLNATHRPVEESKKKATQKEAERPMSCKECNAFLCYLKRMSMQTRCSEIQKKTGYLNEYQTENNVKYFCFSRSWYSSVVRPRARSRMCFVCVCVQ